MEGASPVSVRIRRLSKPPVIAIVDDDEAVREALCDLLQVEGLTARPYDDGRAFLADETARECDCLVTDMRMPEIDGIELQHRLRAHGWTMPVIFITSSDDRLARARAIECGAAAWFTKPVADEALLGALRKALEKFVPSDTHEPPGD
jgi:FixJ family two-component response regulator